MTTTSPEINPLEEMTNVMREVNKNTLKIADYTKKESENSEESSNSFDSLSDGIKDLGQGIKDLGKPLGKTILTIPVLSVPTPPVLKGPDLPALVITNKEGNKEEKSKSTALATINKGDKPVSPVVAKKGEEDKLKTEKPKKEDNEKKEDNGFKTLLTSFPVLISKGFGKTGEFLRNDFEKFNKRYGDHLSSIGKAISGNPVVKAFQSAFGTEIGLISDAVTGIWHTGLFFGKLIISFFGLAKKSLMKSKQKLFGSKSPLQL